MFVRAFLLKRVRKREVMTVKGCFLSCCLAAVSLGASAAERVFDVRPCFRNLDQDARTLLANWARQGAGWKAPSGRTKIFVRGQFFYGLERSDYIHNWYERPLFQDTSYAAANEQQLLIRMERKTIAKWQQSVQLVAGSKLGQSTGAIAHEGNEQPQFVLGIIDVVNGYRATQECCLRVIDTQFNKLSRHHLWQRIVVGEAYEHILLADALNSLNSQV